LKGGPSRSITTLIKAHKYIAFAVSIFALLLLLCGVYSAVTSANKANTKKEVQATLDAVNLPEKPIYSEVVDRECDSGNSVGLEKRIHCDYFGYKVFEGHGNIQDKLKEIDSSLSADGWKRDFATGADSVTHASDMGVLHEGKTGSVLYLSDPIVSGLSVQLEVENYNAGGIYTSGIRELIAQGKVRPPTPGSMLYGIRANKTYWSCRDTCLPPPSAMNNH
jgi:hypothetical protein